MPLILLFACAEPEVEVLEEAAVGTFVAPDPGLAMQALGAVVQGDPEQLDRVFGSLRATELSAFSEARAADPGSVEQALALRGACLIWPDIEDEELKLGVEPAAARLAAAGRVDAIRESARVDVALRAYEASGLEEDALAVDAAAVEMQLLALRELSELSRFTGEDFDALVDSPEVRGWLGVAR